MTNLVLKRLDMKGNIFSTQKCYISSKLLEPKLRIGQYVYIKTSCSCKYLCKVFLKKDLTEYYFQFDTSVAVLSSGNRYNGIFPKCLNFLNVDCISSNNLIPVMTSIQIAKRITVSIVTESVKERTHWNDNNSGLVFLLKGLLRNYIFSNFSVVNSNNFKQHGIFCVFVEEIENADPEYLYKLNANSKIIVTTLISKRKFEQTKNCDKVIPLGGLHKPYLMLNEIITYSEKHSQHLLKPSQQVLLTGPPGSGKTSLVRKVAADCGAVLITVHGPEVCMPKPGDTEQQLRSIFNEAADYTKEGTCVILLDEIDSLCPRPGSNITINHTTRMVSQILTLLEEADSTQGLVIIATTNVPHLVDPAVRRPGRLSTEVHLGFPTKDERKDIIKVLSSSLIGENVKDIDHFCTSVADITPGYVGADLSLLCQDVALKVYKNPKRNNSADLLSDFCQAAARIRPSSLRGGLGIVSSPEIRLVDIGGLETVKRVMRAAVEWPLLYPQSFQKLGLPHPKGVLLYGPPGCAKTSLACALAAATKTNFLSVSAAEIYSPYVGDAERNVCELFQRARQGAPTILFIDEIDALVGSREGRDTGVQERILSSFLTEMDGIGLRIDFSPSNHKISVGGSEDSCTIQEVSREKVHNTGIIVIAATNRPDMLDDALLRPGRFDKHIYVPPPDMESRLNILKVVTSKMPLAFEVDLSSIAEATNLYSGADLANICKEAGLCALTDEGMDVEYIKQKHFLEALNKSNPSLSKQQVEFYENYRK